MKFLIILLMTPYLLFSFDKMIHLHLDDLSLFYKNVNENNNTSSCLFRWPSLSILSSSINTTQHGNVFRNKSFGEVIYLLISLNFTSACINDISLSIID